MKDCCQDLANRGPEEKLSEDLSFTRCTECGCRHFELQVDPGKLFAEGETL